MLNLLLPRLVPLLLLAGLPYLVKGIALASSPPGNVSPQPNASPTSPLPAPLPPELSVPVLEDTLYDLVNQHRLSLGLSPLTRDPRLSALAREHSEEMAEHKVPFGHGNFTWRARQVNRMISSRRVSENVAYIFSHQETAKRAFQGWLKSENHRTAIEGQFQLTGIGVARGYRDAFYFTQIYVRPR